MNIISAQLTIIYLNDNVNTDSQLSITMRILLGSKNPHKLAAVRLACKRLRLKATIKGFVCPGAVHAQPVGFEETAAGALARAWAIYTDCGGPNNVVVGIENGIIRVGCHREYSIDQEIDLDLAVVVVMSQYGDVIVTTSSAIDVPPYLLREATKRGLQKCTVGSLIAEEQGRKSPQRQFDPTDPYPTLTGGKINRTMLLTDALVTAFRQL